MIERIIFKLMMLLMVGVVTTTAVAGTSLHDTLLNQGTSHMNSGDYDRAIEKLQAAVLMKPEGSQARYQLGQVYFTQGVAEIDFVKVGYAVSVWKKASQLMSDENYMKSTLDDLIVRAEEHYQTFYQLDKLKNDVPNKLKESLEYAALLSQIDKQEEAYHLYQTLAERYSKDPVSYTGLANISHDTGRILWAKRYFERALQRDENYIPAKMGYSTVMDELDALRVDGFDSMLVGAH